jgi:predicted transcriptional regulator YdeE
MKRGFVLLACVLAVAAGLVAAATDTTINMIKLHVDSFNVVGISARSSNAQEMAGTGEISQLWKRFRDEDVLIRIVNRADARVIAVYSDYQSDRNGMYTYTLGAKVTSTKDVPPGMVVQRVEAGNYGMFTSQGQAAGQIVVGLWKRIWSLEDAHELHRAYKTDFDVYYEGLAKSPATAHVDTYVGISK